MKQTKLAKICGVSRTYINQLFHKDTPPFSVDKNNVFVIEDEKTLSFIRKYKKEYQFNNSK